jgi:putative oxidoreductase
VNERSQAIALLMLRVAGLTALYTFHVWHKLTDLPREWLSFPDPLGIGHGASLTLALAAEAGCSLLVALGVFTRLACLPIVVTMLMVLLLRARGFADADVESALLYAVLYGSIALLGPGPWTLHGWLRTPAAALSIRDT